LDIDKDGANMSINNHSIISNSDDNSLQYFDKNNVITNNVDSESSGIWVLIGM